MQLIITIPAGTGYDIEYMGNIKGDFGRAVEPFTAAVEREYGDNYIFRLPNGKRAMTRKSLVTVNA
jgi:hypothetical protein